MIKRAVTVLAIVFLAAGGRCQTNAPVPSPPYTSTPAWINHWALSVYQTFPNNSEPCKLAEEELNGQIEPEFFAARMTQALANKRRGWAAHTNLFPASKSQEALEVATETAMLGMAGSMVSQAVVVTSTQTNYCHVIVTNYPATNLLNLMTGETTPISPVYPPTYVQASVTAKSNWNDVVTNVQGQAMATNSFASTNSTMFFRLSNVP